MPAAVKNRNSTGVDVVKAKPMAVPRNGAEHGVLKRTRSAPVKNAPAKPCFRLVKSMRVVALPGIHISKTPKKLMAKAVRITTMKAMNPALWNCIPQPAFPPPALIIATTPASTQKLVRMPAVVAMPKVRRRFLLSPACLIRLKSLSERTGKTHGMRFKMIPPSSADKSKISVPAELSSAKWSCAVSGALWMSSSFFFKDAGCKPLFFANPVEFIPNVTFEGARQMELSHAW